MQITSMSNYMLFETLMGYRYGEKDAKPETWTSAPDDGSEKIDISKAIVSPEKLDRFEFQAGTPTIMKKIGTEEDTPENAKKFDRLELSDAVIDLNNRSREIVDLDFSDREVMGYINAQNIIAIYDGTAAGGAKPTKEKIAEYYGNIAKRLDAAYAEGKFTKEEYDYLDKAIAERMEDATRIAEETIAEGKVGYRRSMSANDTWKQVFMPRKAYLAERDAEIRSYVNSYCKIDRKALLQLFNSVRYGK